MCSGHLHVCKCPNTKMEILAIAGCCPWSVGSKYAKIPKFGYDLGYHATENVTDSEFTRFDGSEDLGTHFWM